MTFANELFIIAYMEPEKQDNQQQSKPHGWKKGESGNESSKWKPGQSGNPNGRPKKKNCVTSLLSQKMSEVPEFLPDEKPNLEKRIWADIVAEAIVVNAAAGQSDFMRILLDRLEGKVPETLWHGIDEHTPELLQKIKDNFQW